MVRDFPIEKWHLNNYIQKKQRHKWLVVIWGCCFKHIPAQEGSYYYKCGKSSAQGWSLRHFIHLQGRRINLKLIFKCQDSALACVHVEEGEWGYDKHKKKITQQRPTLSSCIIRSHSAGSHDWWRGCMFSSLRTNYQIVPLQWWSSTFPVIQPRVFHSRVEGFFFSVFTQVNMCLRPQRRLGKGDSHINGCRWAAQWFCSLISVLNKRVKHLLKQYEYHLFWFSFFQNILCPNMFVSSVLLQPDGCWCRSLKTWHMWTF